MKIKVEYRFERQRANEGSTVEDFGKLIRSLGLPIRPYIGQTAFLHISIGSHHTEEAMRPYLYLAHVGEQIAFLQRLHHSPTMASILLRQQRHTVAVYHHLHGTGVEDILMICNENYLGAACLKVLEYLEGVLTHVCRLLHIATEGGVHAKAHGYCEISSRV